MENDDSITIRNNIKPGDLGYITYLHGVLYYNECDFDITFERYVAFPLSDFIIKNDPQSRIWILEKEEKIMGCIAIVKIDDAQAQLRWFLLDPSIRGKGYGNKLLEETIKFCKDMNYKKIILWTVNLMDTAIYLYTKYGFKCKEEKKHILWGRELTEQKFELEL